MWSSTAKIVVNRSLTSIVVTRKLPTAQVVTQVCAWQSPYPPLPTKECDEGDLGVSQKWGHINAILDIYSWVQSSKPSGAFPLTPNANSQR